MDIRDIMQHLPHRYPFLLVDKVVDFEPHKWMTAIKNVTINEPFFMGHFPDYPMMPGALIVEAMAQVTGILAFKSTESSPSSDNLYILVSIDKARFRAVVRPGDQLKLEARLLSVRHGMWKFATRAKVDEKLVASAEVMCTEQSKFVVG